MTKEPMMHDFLEVTQEFIGVFRRSTEKYRKIKVGEIFFVSGWIMTDKGQLLHLIYPRHQELWSYNPLWSIPHLDVHYSPEYFKILDKQKKKLLPLLYL